jgi:hypothetical protein
MKTENRKKSTGKSEFKKTTTHIKPTMQNSMYSEGNKAAPDNNIFWEEGHNPLSSKGN